MLDTYDEKQPDTTSMGDMITALSSLLEELHEEEVKSLNSLNWDEAEAFQPTIALYAKPREAIWSKLHEMRASYFKTVTAPLCESADSLSRLMGVLRWCLPLTKG